MRFIFVCLSKKLQKPLVGARGCNWNAEIQTDQPGLESNVLTWKESSTGAL